MNDKKTAMLLAGALLVGQVSLTSKMFAHAESQPSSNERLEVASVIEKPSAVHIQEQEESESSLSPQDLQDVYTINNETGSLPTVIQVLPQDDQITSLFINGSEVLRFTGSVAGLSSYNRMKTISERLYTVLKENPATATSIRPAMVNHQATIQLDGDVLATVDAYTAKVEKESSAKLAFLFGNRIRQALGVPALDEKVLASLSPAEAKYKSTGRVQTGMASWYGPYFHGRRAADGSRFNQFALTAAHRTLPFGTVVRVVNQRTNKSCFVKITDRGPYAHGRIIDLSRGAASAIGMLGSGVARVSLEVVNKGS